MARGITNVPTSDMLFIHKKGKHSSGLHLRSFVPRFGDRFRWVGSFKPSARYFHKDADQWDWNKLCGISFSVFATRHSVMIGWRYNPNIDRIELAFYAHDGRGKVNRKIVKLEKVLTMFEPFEVGIELQGKIVEISMNGKKTKYEMKKRFPIWKRLVFPWFGGNKPAPQDIKILLKTL